MASEKPCIYKHTCGFDICMMSDCPYYEPKTKGRKWFEEEEKDKNLLFADMEEIIDAAD